jgi:23S rRNA pseudouridine1911/1915/1917 synthase
MRKLEFIVTPEFDNCPLLHFMKTELELSTYIIKHLRNTPETVFINGTHWRVVDKVKPGDKLTLFIPEKTTPPPLWDVPIDIIFEDEDILIVNKPSGVSSHPTRNHPNGTLCNAVASYLIKTQNEPAAGRAVGGLDKVTSGVMIFAKNSYAASKLNGNMNKVYNAIVWGTLEPTGTINAPIYRPDMGLTLRTVDERGDYAITHWKVIEQLSDKAFVEVKTETGRTHQIRVHFDYIGNPLVGDELYGAEETECLNHAALHCRQITITHPVTSEEMTFVAPLPDDMKKELEKSGFCIDKQNTIC